MITRPVKYAVTPTLAVAGAYAANDIIGGRLRFQGLREGKITSIMVTDKAAQNVAYGLILFDSIPTDITDNATFDVADADLLKIFYHTLIPTTERVALTDNSFSILYGVNKSVRVVNDDVLGFLYTTGDPTFTSLDITVTLEVEANGMV